MANIQQVISLEGGNEYKEGRQVVKREFKGKRSKGTLSTHLYRANLTETATMTLSAVIDDSEDDWEQV